MIRTKLLLLLAALVCLPATRVCARPGANPDARTVAYLEKFRADYIQSMRHNQPALLGPYYAENVRLMPEFQLTVMGKSNALAYHGAFADRFTVEGYERKAIETLHLGTRVVELGTFTTKMTRK